MSDIKKFLAENEEKELLRFSTAGSVDDGKSTLIGRLLADSKNIYEDQLSSLKQLTRNEEAPDLALLLDGLKAEREQGITIDVAYRYFSTPRRKFIIADTPGHEQYTRNMATGASSANLAIVLVDARNGILTQTKRHAFITSLLGIQHLVVAVNKMDMVEYSEKVFEKIRQDFLNYAAKLNVSDIRLVPVSALLGDNIVRKSNNMPWYHGQTILDILEEVQFLTDRNLVDLRFPVQYVIRPNQDQRYFAGSVLSGVVRPGDEILILPGQNRTRVKSVSSFDGDLRAAYPPMSVALQLEDEVDVSRGDMIIHPKNLPHINRRFESMMVWMDENKMDPERQYLIKQTTQTTRASIDHIDYRIDVDTLHKIHVPYLALNEIGRVALTSNKPLFYDAYQSNRLTGGFILVDYITNNTVAAGMIIDRLPGDRVPKDLGRTDRESIVVTSSSQKMSLLKLDDQIRKYHQKPCTIWITGLVGSGKSAVTYTLEKALYDEGYTVVVLDSSVVRNGLNRDLDFSAAGQAENLRRAAECAAILNESGLIVIASFVSPSVDARDQVKEVIGIDRYIEVFINASIEWCRKNDSTGCYEKSDRGILSNLAGVNYAYETPKHPSIEVTSETETPESASARILKLMKDKGYLLSD
tara:strand:- start:77615 stop:79534 length:1920 start_codon:yes stop_codon:yes gene_type:complete